ncbi:15142_t:CDS:10 [Entrophospora sp. SA101]|nr:15142_t:CDS:10 [Entrophospora sp. SA101]
MVWCNHPKCKIEWYHRECVGLTRYSSDQPWLCSDYSSPSSHDAAAAAKPSQTSFIFTSSYYASRILLSIPHDLTDTINTPWGTKAIYNREYRFKNHNSSDNNHNHGSKNEDFNDDSFKSYYHTEDLTTTCNYSLSSSSSSAPSSFSKDDNNHSVFDNLKKNKKLHENNIHHDLKNGTSELNCKCYNNTNNINLDIHALSSSPSSQLSSSTNMSNTKINNNNKSTVLDTPCLNDLEEGNGSYFRINQALDKCEFEQQEPSPWSQSPAPSPIITSELNTNPFFQTIPEIDEDAFDPSSSSSSPSSSHSATICQSTFLKNNNIYSIVHIPLIHPTTAKSHPSSNTIHSPVPIAILSFLSPIVPFPSILLKSLRSLAPFLATTLSTSMIYQQSTKQLSSYASSLRDYQHLNHNHDNKSHNRHHSRCNNSQHFNLPSLTNSTNIDSKEKDGVDVEEDSCSFSSLSASDSDSSSSKWEYATIFSMTDYDHIDLDGNINNGNNVRDDENVYNDKIDTLMNHDNQSGVDNDNYNQSVINNTNVTNYDYSASPTNLGKSPSTENDGSRNDIINENIKNSPSNKFKISRGASLPTYYSNDYKCNKKRRRRSSSRNFSDANFATKNKNINKDCDGKDSSITCCDDMLRMIVDLTPNVVYTLTPGTGDCTWVNMRLLKYTGKRIDSLLGHGWIEVVHQDDRSSVWEMWNRTFSRGEGSSAEYRIRRFDGQYRWFLGRAGPLRDARGVNIRWFGTCTDVHDQKLSEKLQSRQIHIEANEKKYRLLADAIPQIVFTATPKEGINYVNKKWIAYSGQTDEQAKNLGFLSHVFPEDRVHCCLPEVKDALDEIGLSYTTEVRLMNAEGEYRWFLVKCISVEVSEQGRIWFGTCTDINDHKLVEQKLQEAHDAAKKSTESKTQFLSNMSHEIRTPLIGITGMINFMLATNLTTEQMDYAHTIQQSADALLLVINDILDLSKVEAGMMKLEMEPFLVRDMIDDTNELLSTLAIQKGLELSFIVEENVPEVVCGDRIRLRQVLLNIIGNAIKFTSKGEVFSRCSVESFSKTDDGKNEVMLLFEVIDTGEGFDAMAEAVMFKPFSQVDTSSTRKHDGSGLGLVISMQLVELHGGKLYCKSQKGVGSAFYFTAKFTIPPDSTMPRPQTPTSEVSNSPFFRCSKVSVQVSSKHSSDSIITPPSSGNSLPSFNNILVKPTTIDLPRTKCVLIVADLSNSRKAIVHYVCSILPKTPVPEIDIANDYAEAYEKISNLKFYSHILINLVSQSHVISLASTIKHSNHLSLTATVILTTQIQRAGIVEGAQGEFPEHVDFIFKPLNRSKMEGLFDDTTTFRDSFLKRRNTHKVVASQKEVFQRMAEDVGDRGYKVLLVEDNFVGLEVTVAVNGDQCLEQFFSHPHNYFSFILCDLFMPKKDGYETTIEIRKWEAENLKDLDDDTPIPIIALSANVMSDVVSRCLKVGFTDYVSKPVNFAILSNVIRSILKLDNKNVTTK